MNDETLRPTKKQRELLTYIEQFISEHGYSPSYREIMKGLEYTSVSTVALHVGNLMKRGHLRKRDYSARSIEVVKVSEDAIHAVKDMKPSQEKWLVKKVENFFQELEGSNKIDQTKLDELYVLIGALKVLGMDGAVQSFIPRLTALKSKSTLK